MSIQLCRTCFKAEKRAYTVCKCDPVIYYFIYVTVLFINFRYCFVIYTMCLCKNVCSTRMPASLPHSLPVDHNLPKQSYYMVKIMRIAASFMMANISCNCYQQHKHTSVKSCPHKHELNNYNYCVCIFKPRIILHAICDEKFSVLQCYKLG